MSTETTAYQSRLAELDQDFRAIKQVFEAEGLVNPLRYLTKQILTRMEANLSSPEFRDPHKYYQQELERKDMAIKLCVSSLGSAKSLFDEIQIDAGDGYGFSINIAGVNEWQDALKDVLPKEEYEAVMKLAEEFAAAGRGDEEGE